MKSVAPLISKITIAGLLLLPLPAVAQTQPSCTGFCGDVVFGLGFVTFYLVVTAFVAGVLRGWNIDRVRYWDPLVLTAGADGKADLALVQVIFFAAIVAGLAAYARTQTGRWPDLPAAVSGLFAIPIAASLATRLIDSVNDRLADETWFVSQGWLSPRGAADINRASWRDLFTNDNEFDVYRFQSATLTLVVGMAILIAGFADLANFNVPQTLLGILGVSQGVYVAGKLIEPPGRSELHKATAELVKLEHDFVASATENPDPLQPRAFGQPADLAAAIRRAGATKYAAYAAKGKAVRIMFKAVTRKDNIPEFEPRYRI